MDRMTTTGFCYYPKGIFMLFFNVSLSCLSSSVHSAKQANGPALCWRNIALTLYLLEYFL